MDSFLIEHSYLEQLSSYSKLYIAYSGGLDSTVLLHHLTLQENLKQKLHAVHVNHGLSVNASNWQHHCVQTCQNWDIPLTVVCFALTQKNNLEEQARNARYDEFAKLIQANQCLLTGHHRDDQAETLLLQLVRGTGIDGLAGMQSLSKLGEGVLIRPFLHRKRSDLEDYAVRHGIHWVDDESNQETVYSRNFIRHHVIPLLRQRWPGVVNNLARTAQHCRQGQMNLVDLACMDCPELQLSQTILPLVNIMHLSWPRLTNVLRVWLSKNSVRSPNTETFSRLIRELIVAPQDGSPEIRWGEFCVKKYQNSLYLLINQSSLKNKWDAIRWQQFPKPFVFPEQGILHASLSLAGALILENNKVAVKFRQGGETIRWRGQTKALKNLMQMWKIPPWLRDKIPLIYVDGQLAVITGYAVSDLFYCENKENVYSFQFTNNPKKRS